MGFVLMMAAVAGLVAAMLKNASGVALPEVILFGFGVFAAAVGFLIAIAQAFKHL